MNFTVSKSDFYEALTKVVGVVPQKTTIAILTCILLDLQENTLYITGTDLEISIKLNLEVTGSEDGVVAIPAKFLLEIVRELPDVPINLSSEAGDKIILRTEKGEYKISSQPKEDYPQINVEESNLQFDLESDLLSRMINKTVFAVSIDELRPALTGICMELSPVEMRFVGTDGHRLARFISKKTKIAQDVTNKIIIPTKALNLLLRNIEDNDSVHLQIGEDHIVFQLLNSTIYSKLVTGVYPNYERVIPSGNDQVLRVDRELLVSTLRRVSIFSSTLTHQVRLVLMPDELTIHSEDIEYGAEAKESIPAQFSDEYLQLGYNSNYLMDVLRHIDTEEVTLNVKDSSSAAIIRPGEQDPEEDLIMLLMPIRINEDEDGSSQQEDQVPVSDL